MSNDMKKLPIGKSDFKTIIQEDYCYIDKSLFIKEVIDKSDTILLIPRPRRFGKTLNLSMLKYFFDCFPVDGKEVAETNNDLFTSLAIAKAGQKYLDKMGKHPVIFLSFKDCKDMKLENTFQKINYLIQNEYCTMVTNSAAG
jgi:hypothetical protein